MYGPYINPNTTPIEDWSIGEYKIYNKGETLN